eukprot:scaffold6460_cov130-Isochrysis_galbana.AAC.5
MAEEVTFTPVPDRFLKIAKFGMGRTPAAALYAKLCSFLQPASHIRRTTCDPPHLCLRLALASATAKGNDFGRESSVRKTRSANQATVQSQRIQKRQVKNTIKKVATGKVKRAIKRTVTATSPGKVAKRDVRILASAGLGVRWKH